VSTCNAPNTIGYGNNGSPRVFPGRPCICRHKDRSRYSARAMQDPSVRGPILTGPDLASFDTGRLGDDGVIPADGPARRLKAIGLHGARLRGYDRILERSRTMSPLRARDAAIQGWRIMMGILFALAVATLHAGVAQTAPSPPRDRLGMTGSGRLVETSQESTGGDSHRTSSSRCRLPGPGYALLMNLAPVEVTEAPGPPSFPSPFWSYWVERLVDTDWYFFELEPDSSLHLVFRWPRGTHLAFVTSRGVLQSRETIVSRGCVGLFEACGLVRLQAEGYAGRFDEIALDVPARGRRIPGYVGVGRGSITPEEIRAIQIVPHP